MYLGIDIGGTKTLIGLFSDKGELLKSAKFATGDNYENFLQTLKTTTDSLNPPAITFGCVAVPGHVDRARGVELSLGNLPWHNRPIRDDIANLINAPFTIENDARTAGLSAASFLTNTYSRVLYLTISTGIGAALIENGKIARSLEDIELGKIPLIFEDTIKQWEEFAGGRGIVKRFGKKASDINNPSDWQIIGTNIAYGVAIACSIMQPQAIVFGGGVGAFADNFIPTIKQYLKANLHPVVNQPSELLCAQRPNEAVIYGCYLLAKQAAANE